MQNRITNLFGIKYPIIQAGMVWASGWKLANAVSNAGGLGIIGAGSMYPEVLEEHLQKIRKSTNRPFAVNLPLLYPEIEAHVSLIKKYEVPIVFTSAGNPAKLTSKLKQDDIKVVHVVSSSRFAQKAEAAGCDAVVAEGFEAGGHNGREETTTMVLVPLVSKSVKIPVIAAGGIATGRQMLAAMVLGAEGVQIGSRFVASVEASSHMNFKNAIVSAKEGDTVLTLKEIMPVRLLRNKFYNQVQAANENCADLDAVIKILGHGRAKKGMFLGDLDEGELEIGQVSADIADIKPAAMILSDIWEEFSGSLKHPL